MYHSSYQVVRPAFVLAYRAGEMIACLGRCSSASRARREASYYRRHHLFADDVEIRVVIEGSGQRL